MKYYYDKEAADKVVNFIEHYCTHVKGSMALQSLKLEKWQKDDIIRPLFGWKKQDGSRKYKITYIEIPRKNGKTTLAAAVGLALLFIDGEEGAEIYSAAAE